jgi:lipid-binding SYLF domain-containing protein
VAVTPVAAVYSYSRSKGLFAGVSVTGTVIVTRDGANEKYYGRKVTPEQILSGHVKPPASADRLREELEKFMPTSSSIPAPRARSRSGSTRR